MQIKLLKEIVSSIAGESAEGVVDLLYSKKNMNEFLIAKKLKLTLNQTRNILYKLADEGLVSFIRKKDSRKGGWYTYFWTLDKGKSLFRFRERINDNLTGLKNELTERKNKRFFVCQNCGIEHKEEEALANNYACLECGEILLLKDNGGNVNELEKEIKKLEEILSGVDVELGEIRKKEEKNKERALKAEKKKKEKERKKKRAQKSKSGKKSKTKPDKKEKKSKKSRKRSQKSVRGKKGKRKR